MGCRKKAGLSKALPFSFPARMPEHAQHLPSQPGRDREPEARPEPPAGGVAADDAARGADDPDGDAGDVACRALFRDAVVPVARECEALAVAADDAVEMWRPQQRNSTTSPGCRRAGSAQGVSTTWSRSLRSRGRMLWPFMRI